MGNETILYYVTQESITKVTNSRDCERGYFRRKKILPSFVVENSIKSVENKEMTSLSEIPSIAEMILIVVMIPSLKKEWKPEKLLKLMRGTAENYRMRFPEMEIIVHPRVEHMLGRQSGRDTFSPVYWFLAERLLAGIFEDGYGRGEKRNPKRYGKKSGAGYDESRPGAVVLLLGNLFFPEEQMQKFMEWMQPYFLRMNRFFILYDADEDKGSDRSIRISDAGVEISMEADADTEINTEANADTEISMEADADTETESDTGTETESDTDMEWKRERFEEAIQYDTEELYYEYGLVSQVQIGKGSVLKRRMVESGQSPVLFVDFGYSGGVPFGALKEGDFYLDIVSDEKKASLFGRKYMENSYVSPRKYLDTLVKSGYDK